MKRSSMMVLRVFHVAPVIASTTSAISSSVAITIFYARARSASKPVMSCLSDTIIL